MTISYNILVELLSENMHSLKSCKFLCGDYENLLYHELPGGKKQTNKKHIDEFK